MTSFVLDASIALAWCFHDEATQTTTKLLDKLVKDTAFVPTIFSLEIGNILVSAERRGRIKFANVVEFLSLIKELNIQTDIETSARSYHEILLLARSEKLTTYDAAYLELAMRIGAPLATKDQLLQNAAIKLGVAVLQG